MEGLPSGRRMADCASGGPGADRFFMLLYMIRPMPAAAERGSRPLVLGWKEFLDLPELGIHRLKAKMDTGARTSSLHVDSLRIVAGARPGHPGGEEIEMTVGFDRRRPDRVVVARAPLLGRIQVTDSGGHPEIRPVIATDLVMGPVRKRILLTLTDRTGMLFRMIVGRKALEGDFLVDVARRYALGGRRLPGAG